MFRVSVRRVVVTGLAVLALAATGCAADQDGFEAAPDQRRAVRTADTAFLVVDARYALPEGVELHEVEALAVSPDGTMAVADRRFGILLLREGHATAVVTLEDSARVTGIAALPDGGFVARDGALGRIVSFDRDGAREQWSAPRTLHLWGSEAIATDREGRIWIGYEAPGLRGGYTFVPREPGTPSDTIELRFTDPECHAPDPSFGLGWFADLRERYLPSPTWAMTPNGVVAFSCSSEFRLGLRDASGSESEVVVEPADDPVEVSQMERSHTALTWTVMMQSREERDPPAEATDTAGWRWTGPAIPTVKPPVVRILPAGDGFWVWGGQPSDTVPSNPTWAMGGLPHVLWIESGRGTFDLFSADGSLRGHVRLPELVRFTPFPDTPDPVVRGDTVWTVVERSSAEGLEPVRLLVDSGGGR